MSETTHARRFPHPTPTHAPRTICASCGHAKPDVHPVATRLHGTQDVCGSCETELARRGKLATSPLPQDPRTSTNG